MNTNVIQFPTGYPASRGAKSRVVPYKRMRPIFFHGREHRKHFVDFALAASKREPKNPAKWRPLSLVAGDGNFEILYRVRVYLAPGWWAPRSGYNIWELIAQRCARRLAAEQADEIL